MRDSIKIGTVTNYFAPSDLVMQTGSVDEIKSKELAITFSTPIQNPVLILTPRIDDTEKAGSDFHYKNLTSSGFTLVRGCYVGNGGLQKITWVAFSQS